jgi:membrane-bound serine protease (ClpP class)
VFTLNNPGVVVLMIIVGIALIYVELHFMTGILGILSVLCFSLFFWSSFMGGTAGWLEVMLFVLGLGCLALEIFVLPGFGVFGVSGILLVLASLIMAGHSWSFDTATNIEELAWQTGQVLMAFGIVALLGIIVARFLPSLPFFESMVLGPPGSMPDEPRLRLDTGSLSIGLASGIEAGDKGSALTMLRPSGKARIADHVVDVISDGPFISADADLEVIAVSGNRIIVRQV